MADEILKRDANHITVAGAVTNDVFRDVKMWRVNPANGRLKVSAIISGGGGADVWVTDDLTSLVDGSTSSFPLSQTPKSDSPYMVFLAGILQRPTGNYTVAAGILIFTFNPPQDTELIVYYIQT